MAEYIVRPIGSDKEAWTEVPAGAAAPLLAEVVTEDDTPDDTNNYVETTGANTNRQFCDSVVAQVGETVLEIQGWWHVRLAPGQTGNAVLTETNIANVLASTVVTPGNPLAWVSAVFTGSQTNVQMANMRLWIGLSGTASSSTSKLTAEFIRVVTDRPPAPAGFFDPSLNQKAWF